MEIHFKDMVSLLRIIVLLDYSDSYSRIGDKEHWRDWLGRRSWIGDLQMQCSWRVS